MYTKSKMALAVVVGAALGATATQGLHAQAKLKAYSVSELDISDVEACCARAAIGQAATPPSSVKNSRRFS
jgi:hypothetical protein